MHECIRDVAHVHGLEPRVGVGERHHRQEALETRKHVEERILPTEDDGRLEDRPGKVGIGDERFRLTLGAQVTARRFDAGVERAHVQKSRYAHRTTRVDELSRELDVRALEIAAARFVEDPDEVDRRASAGRQLLERERIMDVRLDHVDCRQENEMPGALSISRWHNDAATRGNQSRDDMAPDEAATAQNQDSRRVHRWVSPRSVGRTASKIAAPLSVVAAAPLLVLAAAPPRGATTPRRSFSAT